MVQGIRLKVCGLTSPTDAALADEAGADYLGFIFHPGSPRFLPWAQYRAMAPNLPDRRRVAVLVEPEDEQLRVAEAEGFDFFQIHFRKDFPPGKVAAWVDIAGADRLWLAPRLPPDCDLPVELLPLAGHFLLDTFRPDGFGGSGQTGDWGKFARHQNLYPQKHWILAGGLNAETIGPALKGSGARFVDVNSGVESAPGIKDPGRLKQFAAALQRAAVERDGDRR